MLKSKIFLKFMLVITSLVIGYFIVISFFILPVIDSNIKKLEEDKAKETLSKVTLLAKNVANDLTEFKKKSIQTHKDELKNLTDVTISLVQNKYEQSKPKNLHNVLSQRGEIFKRNLISFYEKNKKTMSEDALKKAVKNYTKIYRHNSLETGYFWINDFNAKMIMHPIKPELNGKILWNFKDPKGVYLFQDFVKICKEKGSGIVDYQWLNPVSKKVEDKISYVFTFEPFHWIIGTGEYLSVLDKTFKNDVINLVNKLRYDDDNYFFISDYDSVLVSHPYLQGKDLSKVRDVHGGLVLPPMVDIARKNGSGYYSYWWKKNKKDNTPYEKITYAVNFPNWNWVLGTGVYLDDVDKEVKKRKDALIQNLRQIIGTTKIGQSGYLYIFNSKAQMLIHPNSNIEGKNFSKLKNPGKKSFIFDDLIKVAKTDKTLYYKWDRPSDKGKYIYDKISWIEYIPELDWYVCSSAYLDEFKSVSNQVENRIIIASSIALLLFVFMATFFIRKILRPLTILSELTNEVARGNYDIDVNVDIHSNDEIGVLAQNFQKMIKNLNNLFQNLDEKVVQRTTELEHQKQYVKAIMDSQSNIVLTTDGKSIREANRAFYEFYNVNTVDEFYSIYGHCMCDTFVKEEGFLQKDMNGERWIMYQLNRPDEIHKVKIIQNDRVHIFSIVARSFEFDNETLMTAEFTDITELEKIKEEVEIAKNKAVDSTKTKSEFLANMSHEIRTPMNGVIGMAHLALQTDLDSKQKNYVQKIENSAKSLLGIINDILDFSKIEAGKMSIDKIEFDLFETIQNVVNMLMFKAKEKDLELIVSYDVNLGKQFYGDSLRVAQILTNLTTNAIKFTQEGSIKISIILLDNEHVKFEVLDTGIGLSKDQQERLFKSFSQADGSTTRKYGGTGLGLAISRKLTELMNGKIYLESEIGKGSTFIFDIELKKLDDNSKKLTIFRDKSVLIADDSSNWQDILREQLSYFGFQVQSAKDGQDCIEKAKIKIYDLYVIDYNMPLMSGIETIAKIKELNPNAKTLLISAYKTYDVEVLAKKADIKFFLEKPINPSFFNDMISDALYDTHLAQFDDNTTSKEDKLKLQISTLRGSKILLAEDNDINQEILQGLLEGSGIEMDIANNGKEAVALFEANDYELILMDLQMPILDGYGATKIIRELNAQIPIVALTANAMKEDVEKTKAVGMNEHLNKPIEVEKLYETLLKYISIKGEVIQDVQKETKEEDEIILPEFEHLDINKALALVMGNKKIVLNILKGLLEFKELNFKDLEDEELQRVFHTLKGLSGSAGAGSLYSILEKLNATLDRTLIPDFQTEYLKVVEEVQSKISFTHTKRDVLDALKREELFKELKVSLETKRAKNVKPIIAELQKYKLNDTDTKLFDEINKLVKKFKFKEAGELL